MKKLFIVVILCCITSLVMANPRELKEQRQLLSRYNLEMLGLEELLEQAKSKASQQRGIVLWLEHQEKGNKPVISPKDVKVVPVVEKAIKPVNKPTVAPEEVKPATATVKATIKALETAEEVYKGEAETE